MLTNTEMEGGIALAMGGRVAHDDELGIRYRPLPGRKVGADMDWSPALGGGSAPERIGPSALITLLDSIGGVGAMAALGFREAVATLDLRVDYIDQLAPETGCTALAEAAVISGSEGNGFVLMQAQAVEVGTGRIVAVACGRFVRRPLKKQHNIESIPLPSPPVVADSYRHLMGFRAEAAGRLVLPYRPGLLGNGSLPSLHGGVVAALAQESAMAALAERQGPAQALATAHVVFMRFAGVAETRAESTVLRVGRVVSNVSVNVLQEVGRPNAQALMTFVHGHAS